MTLSGEGATESKYCRDCGIAKPLEAFSPNKRSRDGRTTYCRPCLAGRHQRYRDERREVPRVRARNAASSERTEKWCPGCQARLPLAASGSNRATADGHTAYCRPCHNARGRASKERNGGLRNYHLLRRYGITVADYDRMVEAQDGLCALCRERPPQHVDHDHLTGAVRGVLCSGCNQGLGNFRDDAATVRAAVDYLERTTWQRHQVCTGVYRLTSPRPAARRSPSSSGLPRLISSRRGGSCPPA